MKLIPVLETGQPAEAIALAPPETQEVCSALAGMYQKSGFHPPWTGYLAVEDDQCVGTCAFKSAPKKGWVEIAYFTFPIHEGRGIATRMASELIAIGQVADPTVEIIALTLPETNASTAILNRLGFEWVGEINDPEDGLVWQWRLPG